MVEYWLIDEDGYAETLAMEKTAHQHGGTVTTVCTAQALIQPKLAFQGRSLRV